MELMVERLVDFDTVVVKAVTELERKHGCMIFIQTDNVDRYAAVVFADGRMIPATKLCGVGESKFALCTALRRFMRGV